jgi:hypothetical protein
VIIEALLLSLLVGLVRGGKLQNLAHIRIKHSWLFVAAIAVMGGVEIIGSTKFATEIRTVIRLANIAQYVLLLAAIGINLHLREMWLAGGGTFLNALVVTANGGVMPVSGWALQIVGYEEMLRPKVVSRFVRHSIITPETHLKPIADIIPLPKLLFFQPQVFSIGDVLIAIAVFALVQNYMVAKNKDRPKQ